MAALLYYLISSLPDISAGGEMPMNYEEFLVMCEGNVSGAKFDILKNLTLDSEEGPAVRKWADFYRNLKKELNSQRSALLGKTYTAEYDKYTENTQIAQAAMQAKNPLEAEKILLENEFKVIDDIIGANIFNDVYLFGYAIKLKLLERQNCFVQSKGKAEFKHLFDTVQAKVYNL